MPTSRDLEILVLTTTTELTHTRGVKMAKVSRNSRGKKYSNKSGLGKKDHIFTRFGCINMYAKLRADCRSKLFISSAIDSKVNMELL